MPNRREFLALTATGALLKQSATAQTADPRGLYRDYARCLPDFLSDLAEAAYKLRNTEIAKLTTSAAIRARQQWVRETFWKLVGGMPERTPLNPRTVGSFDRAGYRLEKVVYESQPGFHVAANLYTPTTDRPPYPGVLFQMGHSTNGKASGAGPPHQDSERTWTGKARSRRTERPTEITRPVFEGAPLWPAASPPRSRTTSRTSTIRASSGPASIP